jgi:16S rRNA processing protein RimM
VAVGRVGRPHGLDGAFVIERASDDERRFAVGATLYVDGRPAKVLLARRVGGGRVAVKLDLPVARGATLSVHRVDLPRLEEGHFYTFELIGLDVVEESGRALGRVRDVLAGVANDNLELEDGRLLPMIEDAILSVNREARRIVVAPGFTE